jgi:hypothetical protein
MARWPPTEVALESDREQDREMLAQAANRRAPLARAARLAASNGMGYLVFGVLTMLLSISTALADLVAMGVGLTLVWVGVNARRLAPRLKDGDADAARGLARNELVLLAAIAIYCLLMVTLVKPVSSEIDTLLSSAGYAIDSGGLSRAFYAVIFAVAVIYQGGLARHFRRQAALAEVYVAEVPEWARQAVASLPS